MLTNFVAIHSCMFSSLLVIFCCCCLTVGRKRKQASPKAGEEKVVQTVMSKERHWRGGRGRGHGRGRGKNRCMLLFA